MMTSTSHKYNTGWRMPYAVTMAMIVWNEFTSETALQGTHNALQAYVFYKFRRMYLEVIGSGEQGYAVQLQRMCNG